MRKLLNFAGLRHRRALVPRYLWVQTLGAVMATASAVSGRSSNSPSIPALGIPSPTAFCERMLSAGSRHGGFSSKGNRMRSGTYELLGFLSSLAFLIAPAVGRAEHQLEGFSSASSTGGSGVLEFTLDCQADFGPTARMCDSLEVMRTTNVSGGLSGSAWVRPVFQPTGSTGAIDASGLFVSKGSQVLSCNGWKDSGNAFTGLSVDRRGRFSANSCSSGQRVACCTPVGAAP
jgi:hypothetical protein